MATDDISPELALVSPELSEAERERLPERPWEKAADRAARQPPPRHSGRVRRPDRPSTARQASTSLSDPRPRWGRRAHGFLAIALVSALLIGLSSLWGGDGSEAPPTAAVPASRGELTAGQPRLLPNAGYVVSPRGSLLTARSGRSIVTFTLPLRCGRSDIVIRDIPVSGRSFRVTRRAPGRVTVRLSGRVVRGQQIAGKVVVVQGACAPPRHVTFRARVS
jgi:hypothetical protein